MRMRHLGRLRASALGLLSSAALALGLASPSSAGETPVASETVQILDAAKSGDLAVTVRGSGDDRVKFTMRNTSSRRLNVIIPPGLVAASGAGQGFQSMGLGVPTSNPGGFGAFRPARAAEGFRSVPVSAPATDGIGVSPGQTVELPVPSVCLNFGLPTPTAKNVFDLMDVETYTPDVRVRKALKSLATLGTSQGVAQATMWHVCNGMSFAQLARQSTKVLNSMELAQASRFVEALDGSSADLVEPAYFQQGRIVVRIQADGLLAKDGKRLSGELDGARLLGLPVRVVESLDDLHARPGTIFFNVALASSKPGHTVSHVSVRTASALGEWVPLGQVEVKSDSAVSDVKGEAFVADLDRAIARAFVSVVPARRSPGTTTVRITNRLPMTIANISLKAGKSGDVVSFDGIGIGPVRNTLAPISAATATVDRVELNGL